MSNYGAIIKKFREMRNMSVIDLAKASKLTRDTIYKAERGERGLTLRSAEKIAKALDVPLNALLG